MTKPLARWLVYGRDASGLDHFLGGTRAVSECQACNRVRRRLYGDLPYDQIPLAFWAERVVTPRHQHPRPQQMELL
jgi:hypothetical protein